ncbi:MAG: DNA polymerase III subunit gamma/tau [Bacteroidales bacterium]|nr:DNA polymerase III subunit gamma/tau [Bacteroidales bacterium]
MDHYIVSARKYRPSTFGSVVGQKALTATLKNAIATHRLAHAYLFTGTRGVGKTTCARIFAKTINCEHPTADGDPCNECDSCREFNEGRSMNIIELDAASNNSVDDIRALNEQVQVPTSSGSYRVFIIDEVHMLSNQAFNAFLKTLEEPPSYAVFILATTEKHKIIPTILSRCQIYDFSRITITDIVDHLEYVAKQEGYTVERPALRVIASKADGAMRDALSIFDQVVASSRGNVTYQSAIDNLNVLDEAFYSRLMECFLSQDVPNALLIYKEIRDRGFDAHFFITGLASYLRNLMVASNPATKTLLEGDQEVIDHMEQLAHRASPQFFYQAMSLCNSADLSYRDASNKNFLVELLLIRLCQLLSPSPNCNGDGEGRLKPIAVSGTGPQTPETGASRAGTTSAPALGGPALDGRNRTAPQTSAPALGGPALDGRNRTAQSSAPAMPRRSRLSIHGHAPEAAPAPQATHQAAPKRAKPVTLEAVIAAWNKFPELHPTEKILENTMREAQPSAGVMTVPQQADGKTPVLPTAPLTVKVENDMQAELVRRFLPEITQYVRDAVENDSLEFKVEVNHGPASPSTWNEREVLAHMAENPEIKAFITDLKLTLI